MLYRVDVINEVILLLDGKNQVVDAFKADGITEHQSTLPITSYTYRSLVTPPGRCCMCGAETDALATPCASNGGYHAFVGMAEEPGFPPLHKAEQRSVPLVTLSYDDLRFYVEPDNLFPAEEIAQPMAV